MNGMVQRWSGVGDINVRRWRTSTGKKVENFYRGEDGEWITDPTQVLYAANELYPGKPNTHGLKGFFLSNIELALA